VAITICVLLSAVAGREPSLHEYEDRVLDLLATHQARIIARLRALDGRHTEIQLLEFASEQNLAEFQDDPRRLALAELREASIASTTVIRVERIA
jgi:uncharacterized protein (DUF1330 family)